MAEEILYVISVIITIIAICLIITYSINKKFRALPFYFNIIFTLSIAINNILRLIPAARGDGINSKDEGKKESIQCKIQAFALTFLDKFMLVLMTSYSIIAFMGLFKKEFSKNHQNLTFIILIIISIIISLVCTIIFYSQAISDRSYFCYVETKNNVKQIVDTIVTSILLAINLICIVSMLIKIIILKIESKDHQGIGNSVLYHLARFIFSFFINLITFVYVILLINKLMPFDNFVKDLIYILLCLIVELFFTVNSELIREIKKIITCQKINEDDNQNENEDEISDDMNRSSILTELQTQ